MIGKIGKARWFVVLLCAIGVIFVIVVFSFAIYLVLNIQEYNVGVAAVRAMYDFDTPDDLLDGQTRLQTMLTESEWERLQLDNESRVTNTYYKFYYSPSHVNIIKYSDGYVLYTLRNNFIDEHQLWVFLYEIEQPSGKLTHIREYRLVETMKGGYVD